MSIQKVIGVAVGVGVAYLAVKGYQSIKSSSSAVNFYRMARVAELVIAAAAVSSKFNNKTCEVEVVVVEEVNTDNVYQFPSVKPMGKDYPDADNIDSLKG